MLLMNNMSKPLFSIIIPVYNAEKTLDKCLESIIVQTCKEWECILVDDGSADMSGAICDGYTAKDSRFRVVHKENGGASSARNIGLDCAVGEWITFIDSDDQIDPDYFCIEKLDEVDLAIQRWRFMNEEETRYPLEDAVYYGEEYAAFMRNSLHLDILRMVAAKFLKRSIIEENHIRFDTNMTLGEDTIFMLEYYKHANSVSVNNSSCYLYYRPENWNTLKYLLTSHQVKYNIQCLANTYSGLSIKSDRFTQFLVNFYIKRIQNCNTLTLLDIRSMPECLEISKHWMLSGGFTSHLKYIILRSISLFR